MHAVICIRICLQTDEIQHIIIQHPKTAGSLQNKLETQNLPQGICSVILDMTLGNTMTEKKIRDKNDKC